MPSQSLHLGYVGGSGGFLALHLILLCNHYVNDMSHDLANIIQQHWNIQDHAQWKKTEIWPNNKITHQLTADHKIYFHCNPEIDRWTNIQGTKLLLFTDLRSQLILAKYKNAWMYITTQDPTQRDINWHFTNFYNNVRDPQWPQCESVHESLELDPKIRAELMGHQDYRNFLQAIDFEDWFVLTHRDCLYRDDIVEPGVPQLAQSSQIVVKLQDIIASRGRALLEPLGLSVLDTHLELLRKWTSLHPPALLTQIGIDHPN